MNSFKLLQNSILEGFQPIQIDSRLHPLYKRFFTSFNLTFSDRSLLDIAILLRQILLQESTRRSQNSFASLEIPITTSWPSEVEWEQVGIQFSKVADMWNITASLWKPEWLKGSKEQGVDFCANYELNKREEINFSSHASDIFLKKCGSKYVKYTSVDQQRAIRSTLSLEKGKTLAISLPTGEGKSLVFKSVNSVGFFDTRNKGLTLVIVPTVTLALDQEKDIQTEKNNTNPYAYIGKREIENKILKEKIVNSEQDICFVSPEAAYGPLRQVLITAAKNGNLRAIVIDEAHIVDEWGTGFRHEYQLFSGLWRQLLESSPISNQFRTILLSATFTQESINLVQTLFSLNSESFELYSATKLRPEIDYWVAETVDDESLREKRIIEALSHLPRPVILYTTEVKDAKKYFTLLQQFGLKNLEIIHGESSSMNRNDVVERWKSGQLDVVVATSAFGLGIDYPHTRSIVHACLPETLNRFYQEVGRGGRDGKCSISLLVPTKKDLSTAKRMNKEKFLENDNAYNRWQSMFNNNKGTENKQDEYIIDLGKAPLNNIDYDSKGHNRDWNIHVILLMARAKLIQLAGTPKIELNDGSFGDYNRYVIIRILNDYHYKKDVWTNAMEPIRAKNRKFNKLSIDLLHEFMRQKSCPADVISQIYEYTFLEKKYEVSLLCSNCINCRTGVKKYAQSPSERAYPIKRKQFNHLLNLFHTTSVMIEFENNDFAKGAFKRNFYKVLNNFVLEGIQNFIFIGDVYSEFLTEKVLDKVNHLPLYIEKITKLSKVMRTMKNLPSKATVIVVSPEVKLNETILDILDLSQSIVFIPRGSIDPSTPSRLLSDVYKYETLDINELVRKVGI